MDSAPTGQKTQAPGPQAANIDSGLFRKTLKGKTATSSEMPKVHFRLFSSQIQQDAKPPCDKN